MRKVGVVLASAALAVGMLFFGTYAGPASMRKARAQTVPQQPNIVFILADDMRKDDLAYMPKTKNLLQKEGMTFHNAFVSNAICCPSRATIMRGQYSHNSGVWSNSPKTSTTNSGGWQTYKSAGDEQDDVATRLDAAGYRTALFGKYLNGYGDTKDIPVGWDRWFAALDPTTYHYFNYDVNDQGTITHYGTSDSDYKTDVISSQADAFINSSASQGMPFFAYVAPVAPHEPSTPAPRDAHDYDGIQGPRLPSFDEADVSDKPSWIRQLPRLSSSQISAINKRHENRVESLQAVDDLVEGVVNTLKNANALDNTYIFFTSDNGWHHGEHRIPSRKWRSYEEDIHMPLLVRGPGVAAGSTDDPALNTDYLPTFTDLAGAPVPPPYADGRSLEPVLHGSASGWRNAVLLEAPAWSSVRPAYRGIRTVRTSTTTKSKYIEYAGGEKELYRLGPDPYELTNTYDSAPPPKTLVARLQTLKTCRPEPADTTKTTVPCDTAEDGP
jgi:arylsulfatase A-like enzyme